MGLRHGLAVITGAALVTIAAHAPANAKGLLKVVVPDWTGGQVSCQILSNILESELGYKVKRVTIPSGPATMEAIVAGDVDVGCELWPSYVPSKDKYFTEWGGDGTIVTMGELGVIGRSGYYVPRYLVEGEDAKAPDLKTFNDLAKYADLFKSVETGDKGRLIGCPAANWLCEDQARADANNVPFHAVALGSETAHWAEMQGAYKRKEPFVAYAWEPHWIHVELDLVPLALDDYGDGSCWPQCGWPVDVTVNYGSTDLEKAHPNAVAMIRNSTLTNEVQNTLVHEIDIKGRDLEEVVDEWMAANEAVWKSWVN